MVKKSLCKRPGIQGLGARRRKTSQPVFSHQRLAVKPHRTRLLPTLPPAQHRASTTAARPWLWRIGLAVCVALMGLVHPLALAQTQTQTQTQTQRNTDPPGSPVPPAASVLAKAPATLPLPSAGYRVGAGDELNFRFTHTPELNTVAQVRADGKVSLPILGELAVAGLTLSELAERVQAALAQRVRRPEVVINVQGNLPSQRIFVGGEVTKPGVQPLAGALTAMQAVLAADGLKDTAQRNAVIVLRNAADGTRLVYKVDMAALMAGQEGAQDITLAAYDVVIVPRSGIANVGIWVDQYIRRVLPISLGFNYGINRNGEVR